MTQETGLSAGIENFIDQFLGAGTHQGKLHTVELDTQQTLNRSADIEQLVTGIEGVKGAKMSEDGNHLYVIYDGAPDPFAKALREAGYTIHSIH